MLAVLPLGESHVTKFSEKSSSNSNTCTFIVAEPELVLANRKVAPSSFNPSEGILVSLGNVPLPEIFNARSISSSSEGITKRINITASLLPLLSALINNPPSFESPAPPLLES